MRIHLVSPRHRRYEGLSERNAEAVPSTRTTRFVRRYRSGASFPLMYVTTEIPVSGSTDCAEDMLQLPDDHRGVLRRRRDVAPIESYGGGPGNGLQSGC
jgi:hypothetical protein